MANTPVAPTVSTSDILAALGLTPDEFADLRSRIVGERQAASETPVDEPLGKPVPFYNDRYRGERVLINGKRRQFVNGEFLAKTQNELTVLRKMGSHVFEGNDLARPMTCKLCNRKFRNQGVYEDHIGRHVVT